MGYFTMGSKYLECISSIRGMSNSWTIILIISINLSKDIVEQNHSNKTEWIFSNQNIMQNVGNIQLMHSIQLVQTVLKMKLRGNSRGQTTWRPRGLPRSVYSDPMALGIVMRGGWTALVAAKGNSRGAIRLESTQIRGSHDGQGGSLDKI
jgi:hypothetical protein